jgi:hypothetical protein
MSNKKAGVQFGRLPGYYKTIGSGLLQGEEFDEEGDEVSHDTEAGVTEGGVGEAQLAEGDVGGAAQQGEGDAIEETTQNSGFPTTVGIGDDGAGGAHEEVDDHGRDDDRAHGAVGGNLEQHDHHTTDDGGQVANQHGLGSVGEGHGAVQSGLGAGDDFLSEAAEGGDNVSQDHAHAEEDDADASREGEGGDEGSHDPVVAGAEDGIGFFRAHFAVGGDGGDEEDDVHDDSHGHQGFFHEADPLGHVDVFGGFFFLTHEQAEETGDIVGGAAKVTHDEVFGADQVLHERLRQPGVDQQEDTGEDGADGDEQAFAAADGRHAEQANGQHGGEEDVMAGKEYELEGGEAGDEDADEEAEGEDDGDFLAEAFLCEGGEDLVHGQGALEAETGFGEGAERGDGAHNHTSASADDHETKGGFDSACNNAANFFTLSNQTDQSDQTDQQGGGAEELDKDINDTHSEKPPEKSEKI